MSEKRVDKFNNYTELQIANMSLYKQEHFQIFCQAAKQNEWQTSFCKATAKESAGGWAPVLKPQEFCVPLTSQFAKSSVCEGSCGRSHKKDFLRFPWKY